MSFPTIHDLRLLQAVRDRINEKDKTQASLLAISKAFQQGGDMFASIPFYIEDLVEKSNAVTLSSLELVLACGSVSDITDFFQLAPKVSLKDMTLPNLLRLSFQETKHISSSYNPTVNYRLSEAIKVFGQRGFEDIPSFLLPQPRFFECEDEASCKAMWQALKAFDVEILPQHAELVHATIREYQSYNSFAKRSGFMLTLIDECPTKWFKEKATFQKRMIKTIDTTGIWNTDPQTKQDTLKLKTKIQKRILSEEIKKNVAPKEHTIRTRKM